MQLTPREQQIVELLNEGKTPKSIASVLRMPSHWAAHKAIERLASKLPGSDPPIRRIVRWRASRATP